MSAGSDRSRGRGRASARRPLTTKPAISTPEFPPTAFRVERFSNFSTSPRVWLPPMTSVFVPLALVKLPASVAVETENGARHHGVSPRW
jgi:hypothetical protein